MAAVLCLTGCSRQAQTAKHLARAQKYFDKQKYREAAIEYMNVLQAEPTNAVAIRQMGVALYELGDLRGALPCLMRAEAQDTNDVAVSLKVGALCLAGGERKQARRRAEAILNREKDNFDALMLWGCSAGTSNEASAALAKLDEYAARFDAEPRFHITRAALCLQMKDIGAAEQIYRSALAKHPKAWELHLALGDLLALRKDVDHAREEYQAAADLAPATSAAWLRLARFEWATGRAAKAKEILEAVGKDAPHSTRAKLSLAEIAFGERDFSTCVTILDKILKASPEDVDAFLLYQRVKLAQGKTDEAIAGYERLVSAYPKAAQGRYLLGLAWLQKGEVRKAIGELEQTVALDAEYQDAVRVLTELYLRLNDPEAAIRLLKNTIRKQPGMPYVHALMGAAYAAKKDFAMAADAYGKLTKLMPGNPQGPYLTGTALLRLGRTAEARSLFEDALKLDAGFAEAVEQLAALDATRDGTWAAAAARTRKQIEKAPDKAALRYLLGVFHTRQKEYDEAENAFRKAIELQPDNAAAYLALSQMFAETEKDDAALSQLNKVLQVSSNDVTALMLKGTILQRKKESETAAAQYERILTVRPNFFPAVNNLACLYWDDLKMKDKAFDLAKQARNLAPKDPFVADTLGWMAYQRGDHKWALTLIRESAEQLTKQPEVLYHLGMAQIAMGDEVGGQESLSKALELSKDFPGVAEAAKTLKLLEGDKGAGPGTREEIEALVTSNPGNPSVLVRAGAAYERLGDYDKAARIYEKTLAETPFFVPAALRFAKLCSDRLNDPERALALARQAREGAPSDPETADVLAWVLFKKGDYKWALSLLTEGAIQQSEDPEVLYHAGMACYVSGKTGAATNLIRRALAKSTTFTGAQAAKEFLAVATDPQAALAAAGGVPSGPIDPARIPVLMAAAGAAVQKGDGAGARALYGRIVSQFPDFGPAVRELTLRHAMEKDISDSAFRIVSRAREMFPTDPAVAEAVGRIAYHRRQYQYAAGLLQECAEGSQNKAEVLYYLGMCYHQLHNKDLAKKTLRRAIEMRPDADLAAEARKILGQP
jgi:tetratricopeptide (TPR) repeat protein